MCFLRDYWMNLCRNAFLINMEYFNIFLKFFSPSHTKEPTFSDCEEDLKNYDVDFDINEFSIESFC